MLFVTIGGKTVKCSLGEEFLKDYADIYALEDLLAAVGQGFIGFVKDKIAAGKIKTVAGE